MLCSSDTGLDSFMPHFGLNKYDADFGFVRQVHEPSPLITACS